MEHNRVIWLDREHKWMELMDFHISSNKSVVRIVCQNVHSELVYNGK